MRWPSRRPSGAEEDASEDTWDDALEDALEDAVAMPSDASGMDCAKHTPFKPTHATRATSSSNVARADALWSLGSLAGRLMSSCHSSV